MANSIAKMPGRQLPALFVPLTTIAQWRGPAVGIVRVERELARRARRYRGKDVAFCLYDHSHAAILIVDDVVVYDILRGRIRAQFFSVPGNTGLRKSDP